MTIAKTALNLSLGARFGRDHGPWQRRRYWLPEGFGPQTPRSAIAVDGCRSWQRRTIARRPYALHTVIFDRAETKRSRKNARRLALRDAAYARRLRAAARQGRVIVVSAEASE